MRKLLLNTVLLSSLVFLTLTGCKKEENNTPAKTNTEKISQSPWVFEKAMAGGVDISTQPQLACYTDNTLTFAANGTGTTTEGTNVCSSPTPANFTWTFQSNESVLHLSFSLFAGGSPDFTIVSLTETNLVLSQMVTFAPFPPTLVTVTFKH